MQQPKFRWVSVGAGFAIVVWILASLAFGVYVANFGSYNETYGALGGVIILLLWLWLTNVALLLGAEVDAELERSRQLQAGIEAEEVLQLPPRDTRRSESEAAKLAEQIEQGRELRAESTTSEARARPRPRLCDAGTWAEVALVTSRLTGAGPRWLAGRLLRECPMVEQRASTSGRTGQRSRCRRC